jgi:F0F1-type ATP synthase assembly protein I
MPFHRPIPNHKQPPKSYGAIQTWVEAEKMMQIAILLPSAAFIGWIFGALADKWLHQSWISLAGIVFGGISGLVYVIRLALSAEGKTISPDETSNEDKEGKDKSKH